MTRNNLIRFVAVLALIFQQGCTHTGPILSEATQENLHRIGVVVMEDQENSLQDSRRGWLSSMGRGAKAGSLLGAAGILCVFGAFICAPVLAGAGAVGGAVYGIYQAGSETLPPDVEATLSSAIADAGLAEMLSADLVAYGKVQGYEMAPIELSLGSTAHPQEERSVASQEPFDVLLEIEGPIVNLLPTTFSPNPPRRVGLSARILVIRSTDHRVLDDRIILEELGGSHGLEKWIESQAQLFRDELPRASRRLSEKILLDYFMRQGFEEQTYGLSPFYEYRLKGLRSEHIRIPGLKRYLFPSSQVVQESLSPTPVASLTPTLQWERFEGDQVTYDLKIWESRESKAEVGEVVYEREGLSENVHTVETHLNPSTIYSWSVRARFQESGKGRITEWTRYKPGFTTFGKVITLGWMALLDSTFGQEWGFYQIQTP